MRPYSSDTCDQKLKATEKVALATQLGKLSLSVTCLVRGQVFLFGLIP